MRLHLQPLICDEQHDFLSCRSTNTNLACYSELVIYCLEHKNEVHSIYTDFQKAFDFVSFDILLLKMQGQFGITGTSLLWFKSYLTGKQQRVVLNGFVSDWFNVLPGVPQGSVLEPTLFIMFVNDIPDCIKESHFLIFADDAKIFKEISNVNDCHALQNLHYSL